MNQDLNKKEKNFCSISKEILILHEDEAYIVFNKPSGLLVIPTPKNETNTLVNIVNYQYANQSPWNLHPCHRLDRETSGAILFAKGKQYQKLMTELFKQRQVKKKYIAFVHGKMSKIFGEFRDSIEKSGNPFKRNFKKFKKNILGQSALTRYNVLEERKEFSVVEVFPVTGRTNQIRIHFSKHGHPLLGDRKFSFQRDYHLKFRRTALHAMNIEWKHPVTHKKIKVQAPLPKDMEAFIGKFKRNRN